MRSLVLGEVKQRKKPNASRAMCEANTDIRAMYG